ncbi:alpha/beta hydrolase [Streptomyces millisiae]|uniref:Alpha/beta hydrolase n=1 Tax=Streptomyces millisiae TaxID=3075542 RepID=A0ABU2LN24_9ACTN|nr:alpha/beta hydrolase [Streptomyces sp. DSM 44918]MDT0318678.1 alpha/beta hydrolase [Streptomyces sp. DSM 44918]
MPYAFDPELAAALVMMSAVDVSDLAAARAAQRAQLAAAVAAADATGVTVTELRGPGVPLRLYRPAAAGSEPLPAVYRIHGGGFTMGHPDVDHEINLRLCRALPCAVVSPDYRLAPEHPYPAGLDDCYAGLCWLAEHAPELGVRPEALAVAGDSAGACLATGVTLLVRDLGGPELRLQYLDSPALDDRLATPSALRFTDTPIWNRPNALRSWAAYLGEGVPGSPDVPVTAAPARATAADLAGLPPAHVTVMEIDPLRDEGIDYARALLGAGVTTELHLYPGTFHGSALVRHSAVARRMAAEEVAVLGRALAW